MIEAGLIKELEDFHEAYNKEYILNEQKLKIDNTEKLETENSPKNTVSHNLNISKPSHYETGIFQSIGFKEFHEYLMLDEEERKSENGVKLHKEGINKLKQVR